ncbi:MAG: 50S ribosomal protein L18 [Rickettsiales bacterium]|jgi:large subunit ribosomal protein L18|nr:50S ribosomal protein L18 [Rickettsiales bacterium]
MKKELTDRRKNRSAYRIKSHNRSGRPILSVFRSNKNIYAQIVDLKGKVLVQVSSKMKTVADRISGKKGVEIAAVVGEELAKRSEEMGVIDVVFNRGPYMYIGRVKSLAEAARSGGLNF